MVESDCTLSVKTLAAPNNARPIVFAAPVSVASAAPVPMSSCFARYDPSYAACDKHGVGEFLHHHAAEHCALPLHCTFTASKFAQQQQVLLRNEFHTAQQQTLQRPLALLLTTSSAAEQQIQQQYTM